MNQTAAAGVIDPIRRSIRSTPMGGACIALMLFFAMSIFSTSALAKAQLEGVRVGQLSDKTRVVFDIKRNHRFEVSHLDNPPRVVVDFYKAKNNISFKKKPLNDRRLKRIRVKNQPNKHRTRVVLDLRSDDEYHYFTLGKNKKGNERVVIDLIPRKRSSWSPTKAHAAKPQVVKQAKAKAKPHKKPVLAIIRKQPASQKSLSQAAQKRNASYKRHHVVDLETRQLLQKLTQVPMQENEPLVVAIDAGHGGKDTGAIGATGVYEKNVTLALAKQLKKYIDAQPNMKAVLTRSSDRFIPLHKRVKIAHQKKADIFLSIHADSYPSKKARGGSVYVLSTKGASSVMARLLAKSENASLQALDLKLSKDKDVAFALSDMAREANIRASRKLAKKVLYEMQKMVRVHKHSVQSANFAVLKSIDMPSLLIETAFISNPHEEKNLVSRHFQVKMAKSIVRGLKHFVKQKATKPSWGETLYVHYKVQRGDTLSQIAANYKISTRELKRLNHLKNANQLYVGKRLRIPLTSKLLAGL